MPHVDLPKHWICLTHAAQNRHRTAVADEREAQPPPGGQAEAERDTCQDGDEHQFTIRAQDLVRTIQRSMNNDLSRFVS